MKKLLCILTSAALLGACEQKTEVAPAPQKSDKPADPNTFSRTSKPTLTNEKKIEPSTAVTSSPTP